MKRQTRKHQTKSFDEYLVKQKQLINENGRLFAIKLAWPQLYMVAKWGGIPAIYRPWFIHIYRKDILWQAISHHIAMHTQAWTSNHQEQMPPNKVPYDRQAILRIIQATTQDNARFHDFFATFGIRYFSVAYEDLQRDVVGAVAAVSDYLGIKALVSIDPASLPFARQSSEVNDNFYERLVEESSSYTTGKPSIFRGASKILKAFRR